jgi:hypothetical protein
MNFTSEVLDNGREEKFPKKRGNIAEKSVLSTH